MASRVRARRTEAPARFWNGRRKLSAASAKRRAMVSALALLVGAAASACSDGGPSLPKITDLNPFAKKDPPLPGKRIPIMQMSDKLPSELAAADRPIALPPAQANEAWPQPGGVPSIAPGHLALANALKQALSADIGTGSSS